MTPTSSIPRRRSPVGWTLIELLIVITLVAALATLSFPMFGYLKAKAQFAACVSHLRSMHAGFSSYLLDNDLIWPQMPPGLQGSEGEEREWEWWFNTLKPYGVHKSLWLCPADTSSKEQTFREDQDHASSYIPTRFDDLPNTAYRWSNQPWLLERGTFHGKNKGPNMLMPDGTIRQGLSLYSE